MRTVEEMFKLTQPQKREALESVVRWVFDCQGAWEISARMMTVEEEFTGKAPPLLTLDGVLENHHQLCLVAFKFQDEYNAMNEKGGA